jgi:hypothetical protein
LCLKVCFPVWEANPDYFLRQSASGLEIPEKM